MAGRGADNLIDTLRRDHEENARVRRSTLEMRTTTNISSASGSARPAVAGFDHIMVLLEQRMQRAEATAGAVAGARGAVQVDLMLAQAKSEAEAWMTGKRHQVSGHLAALSPLEVQAIIAERNELRHKLQECGMELKKIELAGGGQPVDVVRMCQQDMEQVARLRSQVEHELAQRDIRILSLQAEVEQHVQQRTGDGFRIESSEDVLAERATTILQLNERVKTLEVELVRSVREADERLEQQLRQQRERLAAELELDKRRAMDRIIVDLRDERRRALEDQRQQLEHQAENRLQTKLAEQRHEFLSTAAREKAAELQALQSELHAREQANMDHIRDQMTAERTKIVQAQQEQHKAVASRLTRELEQTTRQHEATMERELATQRRRLEQELGYEQTMALNRLEANLKAAHQHETDLMVQRLAKQHADDLQAAVQRQLNQQQRKLAERYTKEKTAELKALRQTLLEQHRQEIETLTINMARRSERETQVVLKRTSADERRRLQREHGQDKAGILEKVRAEVRVEKTKALEELRVKMLAQKQADHAALLVQLAQLRSELDKTRQQTHRHTSLAHDAAATERRGLQSLRERLRQLLNDMKLALVPRVDAPLDLSVATPSEAMGALTVLIHGLTLQVPDVSALPNPSPAAEAAPSHTYDVLLACALELAAFLNAVNEELVNLRQRAKKEQLVLRQQLEDEMGLAQIEDVQKAREQAHDEAEMFWKQRLAEAKHNYDVSLKRQRAALEEEKRVFSLETDARKTQQLQRTLARAQAEPALLTAAEIRMSTSRSRHRKSQSF